MPGAKARLILSVKNGIIWEELTHSNEATDRCNEHAGFIMPGVG